MDLQTPLVRTFYEISIFNSGALGDAFGDNMQNMYMYLCST